MANKIPTEILTKILNNVQSTEDLHSSLLVNRIWCKVTIPILWELLLGQECCTDDKKLRKKALCIRTFISCTDTQARTLLSEYGFDLSSSPPQATFDYPSFIHKLIINNLVYFISIYSQQIIRPDQENNDSVDERTKSRILFREICKLIINRCSFLDYFKLARVDKKFSRNFRLNLDSLSSSTFLEDYKLSKVPMKNCERFTNYCDIIGSILELPGAPKVFKKLESFTLIINEDEHLICPLYESLKFICDNILNMDLKLNSDYQIRLLAKLISAQKHLEKLSVLSNATLNDLNCDPIFCAIINQKETLKILHLKQVKFNGFKGRSSPNGQFISLQELYIEDWRGLDDSGCLSLASTFTQLSSFHYSCSKGTYRYPYPQEFVVRVLETANTNLRNICLDLCLTETFSAILDYCTKITQLTLYHLSLERVIAILNNNFNELRIFSFSFIFGGEFDADLLLCQMAEYVPESLETIEFIIYNHTSWIFSANSLRKFFEGWCCKGEGNKKIIVKDNKRIVKSTEEQQLFTLSDEHFKVIDEYGVQFDIKE
ncbi:8980_t:CDS:1 [Diversispora eburnea]|uniref:8980_t:CDS:1 n=1 Tax=Diversispora eburnea TaxID=1213867 RepID=A0A9N9FVT0_9GLOM|nr:8980_t:CDS:1 [Diversispora eburnea]